MKIFLSWSEPASKQIAQTLKDWLPMLINNVKPWMSTSAPKGQLWIVRLLQELEDARFGIICVTPENLKAAWVLFESGALSKTILTDMLHNGRENQTHVVPFLHSVEPKELPEPLKALQVTRFREDDVLNLALTINQALGKEGISEKLLNRSFTRLWPDLEVALKSPSIMEEIGKVSKKPSQVEVEEVKWMARLPNNSYHLYTTGFGSGHDLAQFSCEIGNKGEAIVKRHIQISATTKISELDTFLMFPNPKDGEGNLKSVDVRCLSPGKDIHAKVSQETTADQLIQYLEFDPPLENGDSIIYEIVEEAEDQVFMMGQDITITANSQDSTLQEFFGWSIYRPTRRLELKVTFPKNEVPIDYDTEVRRADTTGFGREIIETEPRNQLNTPQMTGPYGDRHTLSWEVDFPMMGLVYMLRWRPNRSGDD